MAATVSQSQDEPISVTALVSELEKLCNGRSADLTAGFRSSLAAIQISLDTLKETVHSYGQHLNDLEVSATVTGDGTVLVRLHHYQTKELILSLAREWDLLSFWGHKIFIFPDLSADLTRRRATFKTIKDKLYKDGIKFGLLHLA
ncbi:UNVERIFIED_CONTAM: hypothetical protein FKN15_044426 [Acipenser sinensis]